MKVCGLTGGVGMGKTTVAQLLADRGLKVIDADNLARQLVQPGQPALQEIKTTFGDLVIAADGRLRRDELAQIVFADAAALLKLEAILHPRIRDAWLAQIETWRRAGVPLAVVVIPLLYETKAEPHFDKIVCTACLPPTQSERLLARGWTPPHIDRRLAAQWPVDKKITRSNYVLWTEGGLDSLARQVDLLLPKLG
jgi:dephospho-CoA kinase